MKQENQCTYQIRVLSGFPQIPKICWIWVCEILSPTMFKQILVSLGVWLSISLNAQVINSQSLESVERNKRNTSFNLEEIKVRWKKAALENCQGVPCIITPPPGPASTACGSTSSVSDVDGNNYNTVSIGTQCWTKQNLKVTKYNDGITPIDYDASGGPTGGGSGQAWSGQNKGAYTVYGNESSSGTNATNYGLLYNWYAVAGIISSGGLPSKNICPIGWHVPTDAEWSTLTTYLGGDGVAGGKMKSTGTTYWDSPNIDATNSSDFSAIPGGYRHHINGNFNDIRSYAYFWSASEAPSTAGNLAWFRWVTNAGGGVTQNGIDKRRGMSVRCLKN